MSTKKTIAVEKKYCPIIKPTRLIGDTWNMLIIKCLSGEAKRFNQIREEISEVTSRTLSQRLKFLSENNIVIRTQYPEIPPRVEYELTEMGRALVPIVQSVEDFGNKFMC